MDYEGSFFRNIFSNVFLYFLVHLCVVDRHFSVFLAGLLNGVFGALIFKGESIYKNDSFMLVDKPFIPFLGRAPFTTFRDHLLELAFRYQFFSSIKTPNNFSVDVYLRESWPFRVMSDPVGNNAV